MKVIILAGGFGTRLSEYTNEIPKPMVPIGEFPIIWHIMKIFARFNFTDFYCALGYKSELIKEYFYKQRILNSDFSIDLASGDINFHKSNNIDWNVTLINTGIKSMTGGRVKRMKPYIGNETFLLTYGDGLANINIEELVDFHKSHGKMVTVTAVHPVARFGELSLDGTIVEKFKEKPQTEKGWINGGFFVVNKDIISYLDSNDTIFEREPLESIARDNNLYAYKHDSFWQCVDTIRELEILEAALKNKKINI